MESISIAGAYRKTKPMIHVFMNLPLLKPKTTTKPISVKKRVMRDMANRKHMNPMIKEVIDMVVDGTVITFEDIIGTSRISEIVKLRYICIHLLVENFNSPLVVIGKNFQRDHSTIIHARDTVRNQMKYDPKYRLYVNGYERMFSEKFTSDRKNNLSDY